MYTLYIFFYEWYNKIVSNFVYWVSNRVNKKETIKETQIDKPISIVKQLEHYIENEKKRFIKTYELDSQEMNKNMDPIFYDLDQYYKTILEENNELEKKWKSRILYEYLPLGNVIIFYDTYKRGFAYYSDHSVSYSIINAVAMKYVRLFFCRDLFMDNKISPEICPSPLIQLEETEEKNKTEKKNTEKNITAIDKDMIKRAPFAKLKKYNMETKPTNNTDPLKSKVQDTTRNMSQNLYSINRFIYSGKIANFSFLQKIIQKNKKFQSEKFSNMFDGEHALQEDILSYKCFKEKIKPKRF